MRRAARALAPLLRHRAEISAKSGALQAAAGFATGAGPQKASRLWQFTRYAAIGGSLGVLYLYYQHDQLADKLANVVQEVTGTALSVREPETSGPDQVKLLFNPALTKWRELNKQAKALHSSGKSYEAQCMLERALDVIREGFGDEDPHTAAALQNLAEIHRLQGGLAAALSFYDKAAELLQRVFGPEDLRLVQCRENRVTALIALGSYPEAEATLADCMAVYDKVEGPTTIAGAAAAGRLAKLKAMQGRSEEGQQLLLDWQATRTPDPGGDVTVRSVSGYVASVAHLGDLALRSGQVEQLLSPLRRVCALATAARTGLEPSDPRARVAGVWVSGANRQLAEALTLQGELEGARSAWEETRNYTRASASGPNLSLTACHITLAELELRRDSATGAQRALNLLTHALEDLQAFQAALAKTHSAMQEAHSQYSRYSLLPKQGQLEGSVSQMNKEVEVPVALLAVEAHLTACRAAQALQRPELAQGHLAAAEALLASPVSERDPAQLAKLRLSRESFDLPFYNYLTNARTADRAVEDIKKKRELQGKLAALAAALPPAQGPVEGPERQPSP